MKRSNPEDESTSTTNQQSTNPAASNQQSKSSKKSKKNKIKNKIKNKKNRPKPPPPQQECSKCNFLVDPRYYHKFFLDNADCCKKCFVPKIEESSDEIDPEIVSTFFDQVDHQCEELEGMLGDDLQEMLLEHPRLVCVQHKGKTITELVCEQDPNASTMGILDDVIHFGGTATKKCYDDRLDEFECCVHIVKSLLQSGYMPLEYGDMKLLDKMSESEHLYECEDTQEDFLKMLLGRTKSEDGGISAFNAERCNKNLPNLECGVTHTKGKVFDQWLENYLKENPEDVA